MTTDFTDLLGVEPAWLTCPCGEATSRVPCWTCTQAAARKADAERARSAALETIPARYRWARTRAPELAARVRVAPPHDLRGIIDRVLSASRVVFAGPSGSGKTSLACACLREREGAIFVSALRLGMARQQSALGDGEAGEVERAIGAPLLLIDEVGGEAKVATNAVRDVIFARHDADRPTWVTTGFTRAQLAETYGDGALRRMVEDAYVVRLGGAA